MTVRSVSRTLSTPFPSLLPVTLCCNFRGTIENLGPTDLHRETPALLPKTQPIGFDVGNDGPAANREGCFQNQTPFAPIEVHQCMTPFGIVLEPKFVTPSLVAHPALAESEERRTQLTRLPPCPICSRL